MTTQPLLYTPVWVACGTAAVILFRILARTLPGGLESERRASIGLVLMAIGIASLTATILGIRARTGVAYASIISAGTVLLLAYLLERETSSESIYTPR